jgi:hypothetical protein
MMGSNRFLSDRQAFEQMARFNELTCEFTLADAGALRLPFFSSCLRSHDYTRSPFAPFAPLNLIFRTSIVTPHADVLFVREGSSVRESDQIMPLKNALSAANLSVEVAYVHVDKFTDALVKGLPRLVANQPRFFAASLSSITRQIGKAFELAAPFSIWFGAQCAAAESYRAAAHAHLKAARPRLVVVNSEYHRLSRALVLEAQALGIPTVLLQHGFLGQDWLHFPVVSQRICVWGDVDREWYLARGVSPERIVVTGSHRAFPIDADLRRSERERRGLSDGQRAIVFFAPNLTNAYHERAAQFLRETATRCDAADRWFVRPHPSTSTDLSSIYAGMTYVPAAEPISAVYALSDIVLHDYSTMAFAEFAGIRTICLALDPPYPDYYPRLLGDQPVTDRVDELVQHIRAVEWKAHPTPRATRAMAAGDSDAIAHITRIILELLNEQST